MRGIWHPLERTGSNSRGDGLTLTIHAAQLMVALAGDLAEIGQRRAADVLGSAE